MESKRKLKARIAELENIVSEDIKRLEELKKSKKFYEELACRQTRQLDNYKETLEKIVTSKTRLPFAYCGVCKYGIVDKTIISDKTYYACGLKAKVNCKDFERK